MGGVDRDAPARGQDPGPRRDRQRDQLRRAPRAGRRADRALRRRGRSRARDRRHRLRLRHLRRLRPGPCADRLAQAARAGRGRGDRLSPAVGAMSGPVVIREVGPRDGLQSIATILPTARKLEWIRRAHAAGQREIEVGSFVPARLLPQLADTAEVVAFAKTLPGLSVSALVPNLRGAEAALAAGADLMLIPISASAAHSRANVRRTPDAMIDELASIRARRDASGAATRIEVGLSTAFGCTIQGRVDPDEVLRLLRAALDAGADRVSLADTVGYADPAGVRALFERAVAIGGERVWGGHFHDTRGLALANVYAALEVGIARFDASLGGIGGCPHAPGASGNVATEDLAYMLASMGRPTGIDLKLLFKLREDLARWLAGEELHGNIARAGLPKTMAVDATA